jgi:hypothetical protein
MMDDFDRPVADAHKPPSFEPWLRVMMSAFIPVLAAFFLPLPHKFYLFGAAAILLIAGFVMFIRHETSGSRVEG